MEKKNSWDDIASLDDLAVDWEYTPEEPYGRRRWIRVSQVELYRLVDVEYIPVRVASKLGHHTGYLIDISRDGLAVLVNRELKEEVPVRIGFYIGKRKIISKGIVRNSVVSESNYRVGIEYIELEEDDATFILGLSSSSSYGPRR